MIQKSINSYLLLVVCWRWLQSAVKAFGPLCLVWSTNSAVSKMLFNSKRQHLLCNSSVFLQCIQNTFASIIFLQNHAQKTYWLPVHSRVHFNLATITFKTRSTNLISCFKYSLPVCLAISVKSQATSMWLCVPPAHDGAECLKFKSLNRTANVMVSFLSKLVNVLHKLVNSGAWTLIKYGSGNCLCCWKFRASASYDVVNGWLAFWSVVSGSISSTINSHHVASAFSKLPINTGDSSVFFHSLRAVVNLTSYPTKKAIEQ